VPVLISFWGKGGVGKTTLSSALAVKLAERGYRVYLISTDFVPSLHDVLGVEFSDEPREVCNGVVAEQLTEEKIIQLWKARFGEEVYRVASSIFPVGREIIDYVAGAPGIVEEFALYYVWDKFHKINADFVVWDTMAVGGGIRMLRIEKEFYEHLGNAVKLYLRLKGVIDKIRTGAAEPLELIESWRRLANNILEFLKSEQHKAVIVSRPLPVDFSVTRRIYAELLDAGIPVKAVIVNMAGDTVAEEAVLDAFNREFRGKVQLLLMPSVSPPPCGCERLKSIIKSEQVESLLRELL